MTPPKALRCALTLYAEGYGVRRAAQAAGVPYGTLHYQLVQRGLLRSRSDGTLAGLRHSRASERSRERMLRAAQRWYEGAARPEIADELGLALSTVDTLLRRYRDLMGLKHQRGQRRYEHRRQTNAA